jgi:hypothetical protein
LKTRKLIGLLLAIVAVMLLWAISYPALAELLFTVDTPASGGSLDAIGRSGPTSQPHLQSTNQSLNSPQTLIAVHATQTAVSARMTLQAAATLTARAHPTRRFPFPVQLTVFKLTPRASATPSPNGTVSRSPTLGGTATPTRTPATVSPTPSPTKPSSGGSSGGSGGGSSGEPPLPGGSSGEPSGPGGSSGEPSGSATITDTATVTVTAAPATPTRVPATGTPTVTLETTATLTVTPAAQTTPTLTSGGVPTDTSRFTSAQEALALAKPAALRWKGTAVLATAVCLPLPPQPGGEAAAQFFTPLQGPALGKCGQWRLLFIDSAAAGASPRGFVAVVTLAAIDPRETREQTTPGSAQKGLGADWIDSPAGLQSFLKEGGADFFVRYPQGRIDRMILQLAADGSGPQWAIGATSRSDYQEGSRLAAQIDARTGAIDSSPLKTADQAHTYLSAREALVVALPAAQQWQADAELLRAGALVNPDEDGYGTGRAGDWSFEFVSPSSQKGYSLHVFDGVARNGREVDATPGDPVTGAWLDSGEALDRFKATPDYDAFNALYPSGSFRFTLLGDAASGFIWVVGEEVRGASTSTNVSGQ